MVERGGGGGGRSGFSLATMATFLGVVADPNPKADFDPKHVSPHLRPEITKQTYCF